ncbi:hypothetical protein BgiBS90_008916, partial [Biomphalaria glabrata]
MFTRHSCPPFKDQKDQMVQALLFWSLSSCYSAIGTGLPRLSYNVTWEYVARSSDSGAQIA